MLFDQHGDYVIDVDLDVRLLSVKAKGPFNDVLATHYFNDIRNNVQKFNGKKWVQLISFSGLSAFIPEAESIIISQLDWKIKNDLVAIALVLQEMEGLSLVNSQMLRIFQSSNVEYSFFTSNIEATEWLLQKLNSSDNS
jgi:hypothetical protein